MHGRQRLAALALLAAVAACSDHDPSSPTAPSEVTGTAAAPPAAPDGPEAVRLQRQARRLARALARPEFRDYVRGQLVASPVAEHKLYFQRFLDRDGRRALRALADADREAESAVAGEAAEALAAEVYFPVPGHLERWAGGEDVLVATALHDRDAPIAFDTRGRRHVLNADTPPDRPVLALVPLETDFDRPGRPQGVICDIDTCPDGGGGGGSEGGTGGGPSLSLENRSLFMTKAWFTSDFEGWLKGNPEYELHVMGPNGITDSTNMITYQCVGEHAPPGYTWDMNSTSWAGVAKVFTAAQMDAFNAKFPGQSYVLVAVEDDDTPCVIKTNEDRYTAMFGAMKEAYNSYIGLKDLQVLTGDGLARIIVAGKSAARLINALTNLIKTNDDVIGVAIRDSVAGRASTRGNWAVMNGPSVLNGWLNLEMR